MREDDLTAAGVRLQGARGDEVDGCAAGFVRVVECRLGEERGDLRGIGGVGGVDEDDCVAGAEGLPDGGEKRVAEVFGGRGAVGGEEDDAVCLLVVEGVGDFGEDGRGVFVEVGDAGEEAEAVGLRGAEVEAVVVAGSGQGCCAAGVLLDAWSGSCAG